MQTELLPGGNPWEAAAPHPAILPSWPKLNWDCWNISIRNFKNKTKPPGATGGGSSVSAEVVGPGPAPRHPPARSSYICIVASQRELNVSGASMRTQPEGTLASQDKGRRFGVWEAWTGRQQGGRKAHPTHGCSCGHPAPSGGGYKRARLVRLKPPAKGCLQPGGCLDGSGRPCASTLTLPLPPPSFPPPPGPPGASTSFIPKIWWGPKKYAQNSWAF